MAVGKSKISLAAMRKKYAGTGEPVTSHLLARLRRGEERPKVIVRPADAPA